jgi:hypothetical protein
MSVIKYDRNEIVAALAAEWNYGSIGSLDAKRRLDRMAEFANKVMAANTEAYEATYHEVLHPEESPITGMEIKSACVRQTVESKKRGLRDLRGIRYNLIANDGQDFADAEILIRCSACL